MLTRRLARLCPSLQNCLFAHLSPLAGSLQRQFATGNHGPIISIDRSGFFNETAHSHLPMPHKEPETDMTRVLKALIRFRGGPITVAEYMSEVLTNTTAGYYMKRDVFGAGGDFITSPEVSQLFGEMVGIWCVLQWQQLGCPQKVLLVELGPGRGTLMADLLRGTSTFQAFTAAVSVHLVEVSEALRSKQRDTLRCGPLSDAETSTSGLTGAEVHWHRSLEEVPRDAPAIFIAHEFFDALPVHQFQKTERGWCERLVDLTSPQSKQHLRMVLSPGPTPASKLLVPRRLEALPAAERDSVQQLEVSPQSMTTAEAIASRIGSQAGSWGKKIESQAGDQGEETRSQGGAALIVDYGQDAPYAMSLQAIRQHAFVDLLEQPGKADLSCRVDFSALRQGATQSSASVICHGPIPQAHFLAGLGIEARLESLLAGAPPETQNALIMGFNRLGGGSPAEAAAANAACAAAGSVTRTAGLSHEEGNLGDEAEAAEVEGVRGSLGSERVDEVTAPEDANRLERVDEVVATEDAKGLKGVDEGDAEGEDAKGQNRGNAEADDEGMGYSYQVMAITGAGVAPPVPFPGSGVSFDEGK